MSSPNSNNNNAAEEEPANKLSEYEEARARNIEKNNARLRSLGLISALEEKKSNDLAWGRQSTYESEDDEDVDSSSDEEYSEEGTAKKKRKKRSKTPSTPRVGSRKSRRLLGLTSDGNTLDKDESEEQRKERIQQEREEMVIECREARLRAANEVAKAGHQLAGTKNPAATYEHCLMRVRTMNEKGLMNRVRAIERAAGKHCVVKMAIFKSCLQDENMWELASLASEALERLKALLPPP